MGGDQDLPFRRRQPAGVVYRHGLEKGFVRPQQVNVRFIFILTLALGISQHLGRSHVGNAPVLVKLLPQGRAGALHPAIPVAAGVDFNVPVVALKAGHNGGDCADHGRGQQHAEDGNPRPDPVLF